MTAHEAYVLLNRMEGIGPVRVRALCEALGSPEAVMEASESALTSVPGVGPKVAGAVVSQRAKLDAGREEDAAGRLGARLVTPVDEGYPAPLKSLYDPPLCLYVRGEWTHADAQALAVVGTRRVSHYGAAQADRLAFGAAKTGFTIVSGLARGIDTVAHRAALKAGGRTLAVLGGALDRLYPPENRELAEEIVDGHGAVMSEFPLGRAPDRTTFPYRNRLVSGLSKGVLVVEAGLDSGAMNTAEQALEQGRSVLAVPGRVDLEGARGPHRLIQNGARLVEDVSDILKEFEFLFPPRERQRLTQEQDPRQRLTLSPEETAVVRALWQDDLDFDVLIRKTGLSPAGLMTLTMQLEMKRILRRLPGRRFALMDEIRQWAPPPDEAGLDENID